MKPTPNLNGDRREDLVEQMTDARNALLDAVKAMKAALPHPRNYVLTTNGPNQYTDDRAEADQRIAQVQDLAEAYYQDALDLTQDDPQETLNTVCHTSHRTADGWVYTLSDSRFPHLNGLQIRSRLVAGEHYFEWEPRR